MGRQIAVAMTHHDEKLFLNFLMETNDVVLIKRNLETRKIAFYKTFPDELPEHWQYFIWKKSFKWKPIIKPFTNSEGYYIRNIGTAPVIEFIRSDVAKRKCGRLYWAKYFDASNGLKYDVDKFSKWYDSVVHWVKKNSTGKTKEAGWITYFLPDAWTWKTFNEME
jgi:hypothetical protein